MRRPYLGHGSIFILYVLVVCIQTRDAWFKQPLSSTLQGLLIVRVVGWWRIQGGGVMTKTTTTSTMAKQL